MNCNSRDWYFTQLNALIHKYPSITTANAWKWFSICTDKYTRKYFTTKLREMSANIISYSPIDVHQIWYEMKLRRISDEMQNIMNVCPISDAAIIFKNIKIHIPTHPPSANIQTFAIADILTAFQQFLKTYEILRTKIDRKSNEQKEILLSGIAHVSIDAYANKINNLSLIKSIVGDNSSLITKIKKK